jgi:hypothetical protein
MTPHVTRNEVDDSGHKLPEKLAPLPLSQVVALAAGVVDLPTGYAGSIPVARSMPLSSRNVLGEKWIAPASHEESLLLLEPAEVVRYVLAADVVDGTLGRWISD